MIDEADRLDRLVANLLSLGRIEAGFLEPQRQAIDVRELVDVSARRLERLWGEHRLEVDVPVGLPLIDADHALVEQVVANLLENAVRHSPAGASVRLEARAVGGGVAVAVVDAGPGVERPGCATASSSRSVRARWPARAGWAWPSARRS